MHPSTRRSSPARAQSALASPQKAGPPAQRPRGGAGCAPCAAESRSGRQGEREPRSVRLQPLKRPGPGSGAARAARRESHLPSWRPTGSMPRTAPGCARPSTLHRRREIDQNGRGLSARLSARAVAPPGCRPARAPGGRGARFADTHWQRQVHILSHDQFALLLIGT